MIIAEKSWGLQERNLIEKNRMKLDKYKNIAFWPITFASLVFLFIFCSVNFHTDFATSNETLFTVLSYVVWIVFIVDYVLMLTFSENRLQFLREHWIHLIVVFLPFLRILRLALLILMMTNLFGNLKNRILVSVPVYASITAALFILLASASVFDAEYLVEGSNIKTIEDSIWWSVVTIFTVGYGDRYPVTSEGRLIGAGLMVAGIAIVGSVTATLAAWIISQIRTRDNS